jgi:uncharacterized membrane protein
MSSQGRQTAVLLGVFAAMAILQVSFAGRQCLWVDEVFSLAIATGHSLEQPAKIANAAKGDFIEPAQAVAAGELQKYLAHENPPATPARVARAVRLSDTSPPLYYLLLYLWTLIVGTSDMALRLFSVMFYLAGYPVLAAVARRTGGERSVVPTCVLFAFSPMGLYFSGEGRMYSLLLFLIIAVAWASLVLRERGRSIRYFVLWIVLSAAGFLTHYFFALPWLAMVLFLFLRPGKLERWRLLICVCILGLVLLPWYIAAAASSGQWRVTQGWLSLHPTDYNRSRAIRNQIFQFFSGKGTGFTESRRWSSLFSVLLFMVIAATMAWRLRWQAFQGSRLMLWLWFIVAAATPSLIDLLSGAYFTNNPRYTLSALPAAYLLAGMAIACLANRTTAILLVLIAVSWGDVIVTMFRHNSRSGEPLRAIAQSISGQVTPSDLILVHSIPSGVLGIARYSDKSATIGVWVEQLGQRRVPESIENLVAGRARVFFILAHPLGEPSPEEQWLRARSIVSNDRWRQRIKVVELQPKIGGSF